MAPEYLLVTVSCAVAGLDLAGMHTCFECMPDAPGVSKCSQILNL